jgi:hypothetical protein
MQLYRATALIAVLLIVILCAGYAVAEREQINNPGPVSRDSRL